MQNPTPGFEAEPVNLSVSSPTSAAASAEAGRVMPAAWAIADQVLFAGANFLLNVLLARWLEPAVYGALAVGLVVLFFFGAMHVALLGEPLLVFGAGRFSTRQRDYVGAVFLGHWVISGSILMLMVAAGAIAFVASSSLVGLALMGLGLCSPFVLLVWLGRRACYLDGAPRRAAVAGAIYLALIIGQLLLLQWLDMVTPGAALMVYGISSALVGGVLAWEMHPRPRGVDRALLREAAAAHARYGRWSAATNVVIFLSAQAMVIVAASLVNLEGGGLLRALLNLITPMHLVIAAVVTLLVPALARAAASNTRHGIAPTALTLTLGAAFYAILVGLLQMPLLRLLYRDQFAPDASVVWLIAATLVTSALGDVAAAALRARQRPDLVFWGYAAAAVVGVGLGVGLTMNFGVAGAACAMVAASATAAAALWTLSCPQAGNRGKP